MWEEKIETWEKIGEDEVWIYYKAKIKKGGWATYYIPKVSLDEEKKDELLQIALKLKGFSHGHIPSLLEYKVEGSQVYLLYEAIRGVTLRERIKQSAPFQPSIAVDIAISIGEAIHALHKTGVVHGDLYPENILITPEAQVKVINGGIFTPFFSLIRTNFASLMKRAPYMAPEVAAGSLPSQKSDIYSLGAILYELLTSSPPFEGPDPLSISIKQTTEPAPSPRKLNPGIPRALEGVVLKALQKKPEDRYSSLEEMLEDLRTIREALRFGLTLSWSPMDEKVARPKLEVKKEPAFLRNITFVIWTIIGLGLLFLFLYAFLGIGIPKEVVVPNLEGSNLEEAKRLLDQAGLRLGNLYEEENESVPEGHVISTQPPAGRLVRKGRQVDLVISKGSPFVVVPDLKRMEEERAKKLLTSLGLVVGDVAYVVDKEIPFGQVIAQSPPANSRVAKGTTVYLKVSIGPPLQEAAPPSPVETKKAIVRFTVPQGAENRHIVIEVEDDLGTHTVYDEYHKPGDILNQEVEGTGQKIIVRVYIDDQLAKEETIK